MDEKGIDSEAQDGQWEKLRLEEMVWLRFTLLFLFPGMG